MRETGGQIQHVPGIEHMILFHFEVRQQRQTVVRRGGRFPGQMRTDPPASATRGLQEEHIVLIDMRPDPATFGRNAQHRIVEAPARQKIKCIEQRVYTGMPAVDALHQQRPAAFGQIHQGSFGERARGQLPVSCTVAASDESTVYGFFEREAAQLIEIRPHFRLRPHPPEQIRAALPVVGQEYRSLE
ncbi:MAG: hypothetical protein AAF458_14700 [Pseudomonadota bacterium]